ncbi:MAG: bifunctional protein-disulfide isomerase/oxidoreductase DsbC [Thermodesulfobacteriota bacterium]|nr:MAG: bifunctional protein-disulfide isomerase/oxidoreductase DsbC [Thermodesulfobacteriota bacterium]
MGKGIRMNRTLFYAVLLSVLMFMGAQATDVSAFQGPGCGGECADCHTLKKKEAEKLLKTEKFGAEITDIKPSPVKGIWQVELTREDKKFTVYVDFGKKYLMESIRFTALEKLGEAQKLKKVDAGRIPLEHALVMGDPGAEKRIIVFDDPDCPYCAKLHKEIKKIVKERKDIVFYLKMYPLPIHPEAYDKSKTIVCEKSLKLLEDVYAGKKIPKPSCETTEVDDTIKLGRELGIRGTPAIILPDGRLLPGYVPAKVLLDFIDNQGR